MIPTKKDGDLDLKDLIPLTENSYLIHISLLSSLQYKFIILFGAFISMTTEILITLKPHRAA